MSTFLQIKFNRKYNRCLCVSVECVDYGVIVASLFVQGRRIRDIIAYCLLHEVNDGDRAYEDMC